MTEALRTTAGPTTGTVTFLFTDIEGSTRLERDVGTSRYAELRERHRAILREVWATHNGHEESTEGDSFFVVFDSARSAVAAAVAGQRALAAEPWTDGGPIQVRMGLPTGGAERGGRLATRTEIKRCGRIPAWRGAGAPRGA